MIVFKILYRFQSGLCPRTWLPALQNPWSVFLRRYLSQQAQQNRSAWRSIPPKRRAFVKANKKLSGSTAFKTGRMRIAGTLFGVASVRFWGPGSLNDEGSVKKSSLLPLDVQDRAYETYVYFGLSIAITAAGTVLGFRKLFLEITLISPFWSFFMGIVYGLCLTTQIKHTPGHDFKKIPWIMYSVLMGIQMAPLRVTGDLILLRAAVYTIGVVGSLSSVALCAPSDTFLNMSFPLVIGLGLISLWTIGSIYINPLTELGLILLAVSALGSLIVFGGFTLYSTQRIIRRPDEETHPSSVLYDPYKEAIYFHLYTINIFLSIVTILILRGA